MSNISKGQFNENNFPQTDSTVRSITIHPMAYESGEISFIRGENAMTHKEAGIQKRVSESVYPADVLSDTAIASCSIAAKGAWFFTLFQMWRDGVSKITDDLIGFARAWGCSIDEAATIIHELEKRRPCDTVTDSNGNVTLISRRLTRRSKSLEHNALRQKKHREKKLHNADVTEQNPFPSISSSISPSYSNPMLASEATKGLRGRGKGKVLSETEVSVLEAGIELGKVVPPENAEDGSRIADLPSEGIHAPEGGLSKRTWLSDYNDVHVKHFGGSIKNMGQAAKAFKKMEQKHERAEIIEAWGNHCLKEGSFASVAYFASKPVLWMRKKITSENLVKVDTKFD